MNSAREKLIFALDVDNLEEARGWVDRLQGQVGVFKIGKQLFTRCGPEVVRLVEDRGGDVFLDLKYHDIPNTVAMAGLEALRLGVRMFNVHALGGFEMMAKLVAAIDKVCPRGNPDRPILLAVTILTSSTEETLRGVGIDRPVSVMVPKLARLAKDAGMDEEATAATLATVIPAMVTAAVTAPRRARDLVAVVMGQMLPGLRSLGAGD